MSEADLVALATRVAAVATFRQSHHQRIENAYSRVNRADVADATGSFRQVIREKLV